MRKITLSQRLRAGDDPDSNVIKSVLAIVRRGEVAIGCRLLSQAGDHARSYGVHLNPVKSKMVTFAANDRVIVLAES